VNTITTTSQALLLAFSNALSTFLAFIPHLIGAIRTENGQVKIPNSDLARQTLGVSGGTK